MADDTADGENARVVALVVQLLRSLIDATDDAIVIDPVRGVIPAFLAKNRAGRALVARLAAEWPLVGARIARMLRVVESPARMTLQFVGGGAPEEITVAGHVESDGSVHLQVVARTTPLAALRTGRLTRTQASARDAIAAAALAGLNAGHHVDLPGRPILVRIDGRAPGCRVNATLREMGLRLADRRGKDVPSLSLRLVRVDDHEVAVGVRLHVAEWWGSAHDVHVRLKGGTWNGAVAGRGTIY